MKFGQKYATPAGTPEGETRSYRQVEISGPGSGTPFGELSALNTATVADPATYAEFDKAGNFVRLVEIDSADIDLATGEVTAGTAGSGIGVGAATAGSLVIQQSGVEDITIAIDNDTFDGITHYAQTTDMKATPVDGNSAGALDSFAISSSGEVYGTYTNGERGTLATLGLADFDNAPGLMKIGGNLFTDTPNSGIPKFGIPGTGSFGQLAPGALEMSNVDLSQEFTDMITTQRGFQANSRVITTTDEMLQELVNLKR